MQTRPTESSKVNLQPASDEALLALIEQQDIAAYEQLYDRHAQTAFGLILRIVRNQTTAEEVLQETFWQVWKSAAQYRSQGAAAAWIFRIARNRSLDELRRQKVRPQTADQVDLEVAIQNTKRHYQSAEYEAERQLNAERIQHVLSEIPEEQRMCFELAYFDGLSQREIAEEINVPVGTIKSRMRIGLEKLERLLRREGFP